MNHRAQYIFVALAVLTGITIAVSVALFFLLVPRELAETNGDGTVTLTPRWAPALILFLVEAAVEGILCLNALISSGWIKAGGVWKNLFGHRTAHVRLRPGMGTAARVLRVVDGKPRFVTETPPPDPYRRSLGIYGNLMLMVAMLILFLVLYMAERCRGIMFVGPIFFVAEIVLVSLLTERRIRQDNR